VAVANHFLANFKIQCDPQAKVVLVPPALPWPQVHLYHTMASVQEGVSKACLEYYSRWHHPACR
jgi:hypothetical protein